MKMNGYIRKLSLKDASNEEKILRTFRFIMGKQNRFFEPEQTYILKQSIRKSDKNSLRGLLKEIASLSGERSRGLKLIAEKLLQ